MSILSVENINYIYPQNSEKTLENVSFGIEKGSYTAIVGSNGSGKSTLVKLICGLLPLQSGKINIEKNAKIALVSQHPKDQLVSSIVSRDTAFGPQNLGLKSAEVELRTIECLNIVDLLEKAQSSTASLSLGQTQKTVLSGALALWPEILILDEALAMLDPESRENIFTFLRYWHKSGNTIIHITHDLDAINEASTIINLDHGKLVFYGVKNNFINNEILYSKIKGPVFEKEKRKLYEQPDKEITFSMKNVSYYYHSEQTNTKDSFVKNINIQLKKGTLTSLTGPSGAGKSTILELGCGILKPLEGEIFCTERPTLTQQNATAALFENFAEDDVAFGPLNKNIHGKELVSLVKKSMDKANIPHRDFGKRHTFSLSGGEQRRLAIAGILALDSQIVFFDEPTAGLDSESRYKIMMMMSELAQEGKTVLFSTHKKDEIEFSDREINIQNGKVFYDSDANSENTCEELPVESEENQLSVYETSSLISNISQTTNFISTNSKSKTLIKKANPLIKIILFLLLFTTSLISKSTIFSLCMITISFLYAISCGSSIKKLFLATLKLLPFLLIFAIFQIIFHAPLPNEPHLTNFKWFLITPSKLLFCLTSMLRTYSALYCITGFFISTPEYELIDGLKKLLHPLTIIKIPVKYFILLIEILFRFIPLLIEEARDILKTQSIRGGLGNKKGKIAKIKAIVPLIVPLIIQTIKKSMNLADAITMRYFK